WCCEAGRGRSTGSPSSWARPRAGSCRRRGPAGAPGADPAAFRTPARAALGELAVLTDPGLTEGYSVDWTRRWRSLARAVVRPATPEQVEARVVAARRHGVALVPQGGNTGLVGGSVPRDGAGVVVGLRGLDDLDPVDVHAGQVTGGAGGTPAPSRVGAGGCGGCAPSPRWTCWPVR